MDNAKSKWDRLLKSAKQANLAFKKYDDSGMYYREVYFEPKTGIASILRKEANPNEWNPASAKLSLASGTKGFSEGHAGGVVANATRFFREKPTFKALREVIVPLHLSETPDEPLLIWSAACSTGAEAYSYAMYTHRLLSLAKARCQFKIFATDINHKLIEGAKIGEYRVNKNDIEDYTPYFQKYGTLVGDKLKFGNEIKKFISFSAFDLKLSPRKKGFSMIVCANVFQYYDDDARIHFIENFVSAIRRPGYIFVGPIKDHISKSFGLKKLPQYKMFLVP